MRCGAVLIKTRSRVWCLADSLECWPASVTLAFRVDRIDSRWRVRRTPHNPSPTITPLNSSVHGVAHPIRPSPNLPITHAPPPASTCRTTAWAHGHLMLHNCRSCCIAVPTSRLVWQCVVEWEMHVTPRAADPHGLRPESSPVEPLPGDRAVHLARRGQRRRATCRPHLTPRCSLRRRPRPQTVDGAGCAGAGLRILRTPRCRSDRASQSGPNFRYVISEAGSVWPGRIPPQVSPRHAVT